MLGAMKRSVAVLGLTLLAATSCSPYARPGTGADPLQSGGRVPRTTVYVVRHAEAEQDGTRDPALAPQGLERAAALEGLLRARHITAVYASPYRRTQQTAAPLAERLGLAVETYDPGQSEALAERIFQAHAGEHVLVVGHSNTVPLVVAALGAPRPPDLAHAEYDALFEVRVEGPSVYILRSRYGARSDTTTAP